MSMTAITNPGWEQTRRETFALVQAGRLQEARQMLRAFCGANSAGAEAWFLLGAVEGQLGNIEGAIAACKNAIALQPDYVDAHYNLAQAYVHRGDHAAAIEHYRTVLGARPDDPLVLGNLAYALGKVGEFDEAAACCRRGLALRPDDPELLISLGNALGGLKQPREAEDCYRRVLAANPRNESALMNLGILLRGVGRTGEALQALRTAIQIRPDDGQALLLLANTLIPYRMHSAEALGHAQRAVQLLPNEARAHSVLGRLLERNLRIKEAARSLETALRMEPKDSTTLLAYGDVLFALGRHSDAVQTLRKAIEYNPDDAFGRTNLLFTLLHVSDDGELLLREHREWAARHIVSVPPRIYPNTRDPDRVIRVGYVSADLLRAHPVTYFFGPILANHDPARVHTVCYSGVATPDAHTARMKELVQNWRDVEGMGNDEFVALVQRDQIDILVDLSGHTGGYRLKAFGQRPAPVQITYLGYSFSTGMTEMDYRITDAIADPEGADRFYTERLLRLPRGFCCYAPAPDAPEVWMSPPAAARGYVTFGSLNKPQRLTDDVVALWSCVLRAVPRSRLFIGRAEIQGDVADALARRFAQHGIPRERIEMGNMAVGAQSHLALYSRFDIALDTFPWSGHTTACESLWMGVPVITLYGKTHAGRMVASVLHQLALDSLIASSPDEYVRIARNLARDIGALAEIRKTMRNRMLSSPLCDGKGFTVSLEQAYRDVWRRWCSTQREGG